MGHGPKRVYLDIQARPPNVAYPPRPVPGSVADLDLIMDFCEYPSKVSHDSSPRSSFIVAEGHSNRSMSVTAWRSYESVAASTMAHACDEVM